MLNHNNNIRLFFTLPSSALALINKHVRLPFQRSKYQYILHYVTTEKRLKEDMYEKHGARIHIRTLSDIISEPASPLMRNLKIWGVLKIVDGYKVGENSFGYKFHKAFENDELSIIEIENNRYNSWLNKLREPRKQNRGTVVRYQLDILKDHLLLKEEALQLMKDRWYGFTEKWKSSDAFTFSGIYERDISLILLLLGKRDCFRDGRSRLYSSITSLYSDHRQYLLIDRKPLFGTDITASQLVFGLPILQKAVKRQNKFVTQDFEKFKELVLNGSIYEFFAIKEGEIVEGEILIGDSRTAYKKKFFKEIWFGDIYEKVRIGHRKYESIGKLKAFDKGLGLILKTEFPSVFNTLIEEKRKDYREFPIKMQKAEAKFILDNIGKKLMNLGIKFLTIHDSILVNNLEHLALVEKMMKEEFQKRFGFVPHFKNS